MGGPEAEFMWLRHGKGALSTIPGEVLGLFYNTGGSWLQICYGVQPCAPQTGLTL